MLAQAEKIKGTLVKWRRQIHMHPELGFQEKRTAALVADELEKIGCRVQTGVGKTGVIAELGSGSPKIAIRADMDALPIHEANEVPYKSRVDGLMHACGHDAHTAILLGTAKVLASQAYPGTIRFIFQPSEEIEDEDGKSGAVRMIEEGAMDGVDFVLALHVSSELETGAIEIAEGNTSAGVDTFYGVVLGKGGHGSTPHKVVDPIYISGNVINTLHGIVSRRLWPFDPAVISIGTIQGGTLDNIIPNRVQMSGTIRYLSTKVQKQLHKEIERAFKIAKTLGGGYELVITEGYPPVINHPDAARLIADAGKALLGRRNVRTPEPDMGAEDFGFFLQKAPGAMYYLGCKIAGDERRHHDERFDVDEDCLPIGVAVFAECALRFLRSS